MNSWYKHKYAHGNICTTVLIVITVHSRQGVGKTCCVFIGWLRYSTGKSPAVRHECSVVTHESTRNATIRTSEPFESRFLGQQAGQETPIGPYIRRQPFTMKVQQPLPRNKPDTFVFWFWGRPLPIWRQDAGPFHAQIMLKRTPKR